METMGQKFRAAREKKKMNVSKAAALTRIKVQHLEMMENDDFSKMPAPTYAKGFIRIYASFLGLDPAPLVQEYVDLHLNAPVEESPRPEPRATSRKPAPAPPPTRAEDPGEINENAYVTDPRPRERAPRKQVDVGAWAGKIAKAVLPVLPRLITAAIVVVLLVGIVRCTVNMTKRSGASGDLPSMMDTSAIMKEPPVRYLELPATTEAP